MGVERSNRNLRKSVTCNIGSRLVCSTRTSEEEIDPLEYLTVKQRMRSSILHVITGSQRDDGASKVVW